MLENLLKQRTLIIIILTLTLVTSMLYFPIFAQTVSIIVLLLSISMAIFFLLRKHWKSYQQAECTREKMIRNALLDLLGLLLTMAVAMYVGRLAGEYIGLRAGFWIGLLAGFLGGFVAAWVVRVLWGRLVALA